MAKQCESRPDEGLRNQAVVSHVSKVEVESDVNHRVPPGLSYGGDNRTFGHIPKTHPPIGKEAEFDTDSLMTGKANQAQTRKVVENQTSPTITHSDSTQEIKTEPITAKRLESEQETTPQTRRTTMERQRMDRKRMGPK